MAAFMTQMDPVLEEVADVKTAVSEAVTNSIIHGYEGRTSGKITVWCGIEKDKKTILVTVKDHGIGVSEEDRQRIFRSFERNRFPWFTKIIHEGMADFLHPCPVFPAEQIRIFLFLHLYGFRAIGEGSGKNRY